MSGRHELTSAPERPEIMAEALMVRGPSSKAAPMLWDLSVVPPKWTPPALTSTALRTSPANVVSLEMSTMKALGRLRKLLTKLCSDKGMKANLRSLTFERWRFSAKHEEEEVLATAIIGDKEKEGASSKKRKRASRARSLHPLIPSTTSSSAEDDLATELSRQGLSKSDATEVAASLGEASRDEANKLLKLAEAVQSGRVLKTSPIAVTQNRYTLDMVCGKVQVQLSRHAYEKLLYFNSVAMPSEKSVSTADGENQEKASDDNDETSGNDRGNEALNQRLFALLIRYKTLQGAGFQAAIGPPVWRVLQSRLHVGLEGFGSPLNAYLPAFGSAFPDVDGPFGSRGSFFALRLSGGSIAVNPPFVHSVMDAMAEHIECLLKAASERIPIGSHTLSFCVFLPGWQECVGFQKLSNSTYLRRLILIAATEHGYCDGAAYQRQDPYRFSPYDTAVFVLQTDRAVKKWPADDAFEHELRIAFAQCTPSESAVKRQSKKGKGAYRANSGEK